MGVVSVGPM
nr:TPA_asm: M94 uORF 1 [Murid betaherpesvirus 1]DBA07853.1 TPA_asm: M94 uORF 1 [Murid betaherpesvirus 1]